MGGVGGRGRKTQKIRPALGSSARQGGEWSKGPLFLGSRRPRNQRYLPTHLPSPYSLFYTTPYLSTCPLARLTACYLIYLLLCPPPYPLALLLASLPAPSPACFVSCLLYFLLNLLPCHQFYLPGLSICTQLFTCFYFILYFILFLDFWNA